MVKKIAFFLPHFDIGGVERVILNLLTHLDRNRFEPSLILSSNRGAFLEQLPKDIKVTSFDGASMRNSLLKLRNHIKTQRIDILYGGTNAANLSLVAACLAINPKPVIIISEHTPPSLFLDNAKWRPVRILAMKLLYPHADCLAVPTEQIAQELQFVIGRQLPTATLSNPLISANLLEEGINNPAQEAKGRLKLIAAGRLVKLKGFDILLNSLRVLLDQGVDVELTILGEGPERTNLEQQLKILNLSERVHLPGNVTQPTDYFKKSSFFILSSRQEGFGNVLIEAMSCGIPVIAADCPVGPREILQGGHCGVLVSPDNPEALAAAIAELAVDQARINSLRAIGLQRATDFTIEKAVGDFENLALKLTS